MGVGGWVQLTCLGLREVYYSMGVVGSVVVHSWGRGLVFLYRYHSYLFVFMNV